MTTRYVSDWRYLVVGVLATLVLTAVAAINSQDAVQGVVLGVTNLGAYLGILWFAETVKVAPKLWMAALAGAAMVACFIVLMAVGNAVASGPISLLPDRPSWFFVPGAAAIWVAVSLWRVKRGRDHEHEPGGRP